MELADDWKRPRSLPRPMPGPRLEPKALRARVKEAFRTGVEHSALGDRLLWRLPESGRPSIALTFDDGPDPDATPRILDILAEHGARATFFLVGSAALRHPELVQRICREGHAIGNHTHTHARCKKLSLAALHREIGFTDVALRVACPEVGLPVFRPPFGELRSAHALWLACHGRRIAFWSRDSRDYRDAPASEIVRLGQTLAHRDMVLLHDRFAATQAALPELLRVLRDRGLEPAPLPSEGS